MTDAVTRINEGAAALAELAQIAQAIESRPELIRKARAANISWPDIAEAARVSRVTAINLSKIE